MSAPEARHSSASTESKRQVFLDTKGWRARITNACLLTFSFALLGFVLVIALGVLWAPSMPPVPALPADPAGAVVAAKRIIPLRSEPEISLAQNRSGLVHPPQQLRLGFASQEEGSLLSLRQHAGDLDGIIPRWLALMSGSNGAALRMFRDPDETLQWLRANASGVSVYPELEIGLSDVDLFALFGDVGRRNALASQIEVYLREHGLAGIVVNVTGIPDAACENMASLFRELRGGLRDDARKVFAVIAPDARLGCLRPISEVVDYVIAATQDEAIERHTAGTPASQGWFEDRVRTLVASVPASKLIVTIGAFASDVSWSGNWTTIPVQRAWDILHQERSRVEFDANALNASFVYAGTDGGQHQVWLLDGVTAFNQAQAALAMPIAGIAVWRLGLEDPSLWRVVGRGRKPDADALRALEDIPPGYGNYRFVQGALISAGPDLAGKRTLVYDPAQRLVVDEQIVSPPLRGEIAIWRPSDPKAVAVTFDDGPDPRFTGRILDILKEKGVHATFYLIGRNVLSSPDLVRRMYAEGHDIGSHTFSHPNAFAIDTDRFEMELNATQRILQATAGFQTNLLRPPYGSLDFGYMDAGPQVIQAATRLGYVIGGMDVESCDFCGLSAEWIIRIVEHAVVDGHNQIILMHDSGGDREATVTVLPHLIDELRAAGFHFVSTHELVGLPREAVMHPWHPLASVADVQAQAWRRLVAGAQWTGERGPELMIGTAVLGLARLFLIAVLAVIQFFWSARRRRRLREPYRGSIEVLVPAYNEEKIICRTVEALLAARTLGTPPQVVVIDDGSKDRTSEVLRERFADEPRVTVLRKENGGKAAALNYGIIRSTADVIVAIDGDTILLPEAIERLTRSFCDPRVGAVAGSVIVGNKLNLMTRFQALEYVTSQNLDRRAFELFNAISVVPGAIGAWRRQALIEVGGYARDTLAEDADLTFAVQMQGWRVLNEPSALALTEAPETLRAFMKQRFRWMFGTLQVACKHVGALIRRPTGLTFIAIPNIFLFQILFTLLAPIVDIFLLWTVLGGFYFGLPNQTETVLLVGKYWLVFQVADCMGAVLAILLSGKGESGYWRLVPLLLLQRFTYRQLLYVTAIRSLLAAIKGTLVGWGKLVRTGNVLDSAWSSHNRSA
jgi:cellulose synthase/poly-beta-1,6-N-acetylglucosamine synthase-like glycosyltransferase/peptidoglycan/xylan/chitin deacetylase (PgdA/CDA1 family)